MKGAADRPGDAGRDPGPRPGRAPESAAFEVVKVGRRGILPGFAIIGFVAVLASMIAIAAGGQRPTDSKPSNAVAAASVPATVAPDLASPAATPPLASRVPFDPLTTSDPGSTEIRLTAQRQPTTVFVHGDVYVAHVTWVFVALEDATGQVASWASVSVPGGAGPGVAGGPTMRFDVDLAVPADVTGAVSIHATAYDDTGHVVGSTRLPIAGAVAADPPAVGEALLGAGDTAVTLRTPTGSEAAITGPSVSVAGTLTVYANSVLIALAVDQVTQVEDIIINTNPDGGLRPDYTPTFHVDLPLPDPRPIGEVWVVVTAYDRTGTELGTVRQAVLIGAVAAG